MSRYKGLFTFDADNHRYVPVEQANGIISDMNYRPEQEEEPKEYWYINRCYEAHATSPTQRNMTADQEIGNYFETKEEAEKAVEKLKAWKRLKDKGFQFYSVDYEDQTIVFEWANDWLSLTCGEQAEAKKDLKLLFGGILFGR